ncbi:MAG TPA: pyruvate kinase [Blastocatellia bacterium]|nr:pyruvate kinase [Blastocatellia bacterium]
MRRAKIVATIGPACESEDRLRQLMLAGIDVARVNMSHGEREHHREVIARIRRVAGELDKPVAVMLDLSGPKIRTGKLRGGEAQLEDGSDLHITTEQIEGDASRFSTNYPLLPRDLHSGDRILIDDGQIELQVLQTTSTDVVARVIHGGALGDHKGINLPGASVSIPSVTEKDVADLRFGIENEVDLVAQSFVRRADDCKRARELIKELGGDARLLAKIEKPEAVEDLANILDVTDGVMVARGDLAVETSPERVPVLQKKIIRDALLAQKLTITATQMLQSMIENPRPTRAEASDVSNAILDGSDAVMLSGETAVGRFPVEAVIMMDRIICSTEQMGVPARALLREAVFGRQSGSYGSAVAQGSVYAADEARCRSIVVITRSGHMGRRIAALRPSQRIIALTSNAQTRRQLAASWGVEPHSLDSSEAASSGLLPLADRALLAGRLAERGEAVIVMAGRLSDAVISLSMKIHTVGELSGE